MQKYTISQIIRTIEKLFKNGYTTTEQIKKIKWDKLDKICDNFTPIEKSLIMDFRDAVVKRKIVEFLAGKEEQNKENANYDRKL